MHRHRHLPAFASPPIGREDESVRHDAFCDLRAVEAAGESDRATRNYGSSGRHLCPQRRWPAVRVDQRLTFTRTRNYASKQSNIFLFRMASVMFHKMDRVQHRRNIGFSCLACTTKQKQFHHGYRSDSPNTPAWRFCFCRKPPRDVDVELKEELNAFVQASLEEYAKLFLEPGADVRGSSVTNVDLAGWTFGPGQSSLNCNDFCGATLPCFGITSSGWKRKDQN